MCAYMHAMLKYSFICVQCCLGAQYAYVQQLLQMAQLSIHRLAAPIYEAQGFIPSAEDHCESGHTQ